VEQPRVDVRARLTAIARDHSDVGIAGALAAVLAIAYLIAPLSGQDLAAQIARADFAAAHPVTPVDLRWFGGSLTFGYSLWTPPVMAWIGVRLCGAICSVIATTQATLLFVRAGAKRPLVGGVLMALSQTLNLVVGRVTFSLGMIFGLGALLALASHEKRLGLGPRTRSAVLTFVAAAASPVVALFLWVCTGALVLTGKWRDGLALFAGTIVPVVVATRLFGDGGAETFTRHTARDALLASLAVAVFLPRERRAIRIGALISAAMVLIAYFVDTPVGNNAARLSLVFAVPLVGAFVTWRPVLAGIAVLATAYPQQVVQQDDFNYSRANEASYYQPLVDEIHSLGSVRGRVDIPETSGHWETAYVARSLPLVRGWIRQVDTRLNGATFYNGPPSAQRYQAWLLRNTVQYVAVPDTPLTDPGTSEVTAIDRHPPFLKPVWHNADWRLFAVVGFRPVVGPPGKLRRIGASELELTAPPHAHVVVNLRWFAWLGLHAADPGACIARGPDGQVELTTGRGGTYRIGSSLFDHSGHC
jgi:hypothetical protein